jgi:hypothetical protein
MVLGASTDWFTQSSAAPIGWFQQFTIRAHSSILNESWFQNLILAFSAAIAIWTISSSSRHERRRATVDIVRDQQKDEVLIAARATIRGLEDANGKIDFDTLLLQKDSAELRAIYNVLNSYEFIASGMRTGAFDETTYKRMYYHTVTDHWIQFQEFVEKYRSKTEDEYRRQNRKDASAETLFQDFQSLATNWLKHPLKRNRSWRGFLKKKVAASVSKQSTATKPAAPPVHVQPAPSAQTQRPAQKQAPASVQPKPPAPPAPPPPPTGTSI